MRKVLVSIISFLLIFPMLFSVVGCKQAEQTEKKTDYYKLSYYDGCDEELGYNKSLFYQNDTNKVGPDPSVVYGKGSDGNNYYYVFPTGNMRSIYGYRSTNLADGCRFGIYTKTN